MQKKIEDFKIGESASLEHTITQADLDKFVELTGDDNAIHVDPDFASTTSFKKPVAHGMLGASFISTIIGTKLPGNGALWFSQNLTFLLPVRIGDRLRIEAEIQKIDKRQQILELSTIIFNQHRKVVTEGTAKVKLIKSQTPISPPIESGNQSILVIGGTGGIGSALIEILAKDSRNHVTIHYNSNETKAKELMDIYDNNKVHIQQADVSDIDQVQHMIKTVVQKFGKISAVVNCATGYVANNDFEEIEWQDFQKQIDIHLKGSYNLMKCATPFMKEKSEGNFINILTQAIEYPFSNLMTYTTAKAGLMGMTKAAALDLAKYGIRVNAVSPGITDTDLNADLPEKVKLFTEAKTPRKRLAKANDVANAIEFLLSERSNFLTGETIRINGGQIMM